ncbi:MAG: AAA family ATPase, partial [Akkermansiaceae bacterium]|nr:AAA family ATPase [Akkermansiaceae bacterium]NIS14087.1 AAA family ATPase [Thermoplasmata archaeon]
VMLGGDSTIGKTPFLLQMGLCIATGVPFLHIPTRRAKVLHIDLENSDKDLGEKVLAMAEGLGLKEIPAHFMALAAMGTEEWDEPGYKLED